MSDTFGSPLDGDVYINLESDLSLTELVHAITDNPAALHLITIAVRDELVRLVRSKPDLFAQWAQKPLPPAAIAPNVKRRLT